MTDALHAQLAAALRRVVPYSDHLPPTAAAEVREALAAFERASAQVAIVQKSGALAQQIESAQRSLAATPAYLHVEARDPDQVWERADG